MQQPLLYTFLMKRKKLNKLFDSLACEDILDKLGFASEKNLVMKECYINFEQIRLIKDTLKKVEGMCIVIEKHIKECSKCKEINKPKKC